MFFGKFIITLVSAFIGYIIITRVERYDEKLYSPFLPTIIFAFIAYVIAALFMMVYGMACDSILHCFLADEELQEDGTTMHAPEPLSEFMNKERNAENRKCCK
jgi:hypothetical protein